MIQSLLFNVTFFMLGLMHRIRSKIQRLKTLRKHKVIDLHTQNEVHIGHDAHHHFGMLRSGLMSKVLYVHHAFLRMDNPSDYRFIHLRFDALTRFVSWSQAPGGRSKVQVKTFKKVYDEHHVDQDLHRYDVMIWLNDWKDVLLKIKR